MRFIILELNSVVSLRFRSRLHIYNYWVSLNMSIYCTHERTGFRRCSLHGNPIVPLADHPTVKTITCIWKTINARRHAMSSPTRPPIRCDTTRQPGTFYCVTDLAVYTSVMASGICRAGHGRAGQIDRSTDSKYDENGLAGRKCRIRVESETKILNTEIR